jgi:RNA polymerase sigma factor
VEILGGTARKEYNHLHLEEILDQIKRNDNLLREQFINNYINFIMKVVSNTLSKHVDIKNSDELSIGLYAFNEAIDRYDKEKKCNFFAFAEQVIQRRIIDYIRRNKKSVETYPFTYFCNEDNDFEEKYLVAQETRYENIEIKDEIERLEQELNGFGITLEDLISVSPKHKDSKQLSINIAETLCNNDILFNKLYESKRIPKNELMKVVNVNQKTIDRNRKYIIAVSLILKSNLTILKS